MDNLDKIISSFGSKNSLEPQIWSKNKKLQPKVRKNLLLVANQFIETFGFNVVIDDVVMIGSIANYNWSEYSDIDLHIIIDFNQFPKESKSLYIEFFDLKKIVFNQARKIKIYGFPVEVFVENKDDVTRVSSGVYSVKNDEWINEPQRHDSKIEKDDIINSSKKWMRTIDTLINNLDEKSIKTIEVAVKDIKRKLKKYRNSGLLAKGEFGLENMVYKFLRRNGYLDKLYSIPNQAIDNKLTLKEATTNIGGNFKTDLENSPTHHRSRGKKPNEYSDNAWDVFAPVGTKVYSYTDGVVNFVRTNPPSSGPIYGTGITIKGINNYPDIFYTHLKNVRLKSGDKVQVGDYIGEIGEWQGHSGMEHVHIDLPLGYHLRDFIKDKDKIFSGKKKEKEENKKEKSYDDRGFISKIVTSILSLLGLSSSEKTEEDFEDSSKSEFLKKLLKISETGKEFKYERGESYEDDDVKLIQTGLQYLGFLSPKFGIDGIYGLKTEQAVKKFQDTIGQMEDGIMKKEDIAQLYTLLIIKGFSDSDLQKIQKNTDFEFQSPENDKEFYKEILKGIDAPITKENLRFLYAWRQAEGAYATNNPFNTTYNLSKDKKMTNYNSVKVKNYSKPEYGLEATVKTLKLKFYECLVNGMRNDVGSDELARCLETTPWGTGGLVIQVLKGKVNPPPISR